MKNQTKLIIFLTLALLSFAANYFLLQDTVQDNNSFRRTNIVQNSTNSQPFYGTYKNAPSIKTNLFTHSNVTRTDRKIYVLSLYENKDEPERFNKFLESWAKNYPEIVIERYLTSVSLRGLSITFASFQIFLKAISEENIEYAFILEDDAIPFFNDFERRFNETIKSWPEDSSTLFLGSHHIKADKSPQIFEKGISKIEFGYGTYAYVVRRKYFKTFVEYFQTLIEGVDAKTKAVNPDVTWWETIFKKNPAYISVPLLIDHHPGYSSTWHRKRKDAWAGKPEWWNITYNFT